MGSAAAGLPWWIGVQPNATTGISMPVTGTGVSTFKNTSIFHPFGYAVFLYDQYNTVYDGGKWWGGGRGPSPADGCLAY
jgi:hypothetical protein